MSTITFHSRIMEMLGKGEYNNSNGFTVDSLRLDVLLIF